MQDGRPTHPAHRPRRSVVQRGALVGGLNAMARTGRVPRSSPSVRSVVMTFRPDLSRAPTIGQRIAIFRKRCGLSQVQLAMRAECSVSWISALERGTRHIDSLSALRLIAKALGVTIGDLADENMPAVRDPARRQAMVGGLRHVLSVQLARTFPWRAEDYTAAGLLPSPEWDPWDPTAAATLWELAERSDYQSLASRLPTLLARAEGNIRLVPEDDERAPAMLRQACELYQVASWLLTSVGETELAWVAGERAAALAERAADNNGVLAATYRIAHALLTATHFAEVHVIARMNRLLRSITLAARDGRDGIAVYGALMLTGAIAAAHLDAADEADEFLRTARLAAEIVGEGRNDHHLQFGPTNLALHEVAVAVELKRPAEALRLAEEIDASVLSAERQAYLLVDTARAHAQSRNLDMAVHLLLDAEKLAPDQVHHHWAVQSLVAEFVQRRRGKPARRIAALAERVGAL